MAVRSNLICLSLLVLFAGLLFSCGSMYDPEQSVIDTGDKNAYIIVDTLTPVQQSAFDALNIIQKQGTQLYSTFPGLKHSCPSPDTNFTISQADFLTALQTLLERSYAHIEAKERDSLARAAVLAQDVYDVIRCGGASEDHANTRNNSLYAGTWVLPQILGKRDVVIEW